MRRLLVVLSASVALVAAPAASAHAAAPTTTATPSGIGLLVVPQRLSATPDDGMPLRVTVTNRGTAPCAVVANPGGGVRVAAVTRDGQPVPSVILNRAYLDGYESALRSDVRTLNPGQSASFTLRVGAGAPLTATTPRSESSAIVERWMVDRPGTYRVELRYAPPAMPGSTPCVGPSASASAEFALAEASIPISWYILGALLLAVLAVLSWWLVARRKQPAGKTPPAGPAAAAALVAVLVAGILAATPGSARAGITAPPPSSPAFMSAVNACLVQLRVYDPAGLLAYFDGPGAPSVEIRPATRWQDTYTDGQAGNPSADIGISWDPDRAGAFAGGTAYEPCAALEHELSHAYDYAHGADGDNEKWCDGTGVSVAQVRAMLIENQFRAKNNQPPHAYDGLNKIPTSLDQCAEPPAPGSRSPLVYPSCLGAGGPAVDGGGCAATDGDPHLTTFDGRRYDLQSAGEFVAVRGADIEMQVRQQPVPGSRTVAVNTAIAIRATVNRIGFYLVNGLLVVHRGGAVIDPAPGDTALDDGVVLTRRPGDVPGNGDGYTVSGPDGSMLYVDRIGTSGLLARVKLAAVRAGTVSGLLGDFDGDPSDDLVTPSGTKLPDPPPADQVRGTFADGWRVNSLNSLFDYLPGQSTATFTDRAFPDPTAPGPDPAATAHAKAICAAAGVTDPASLANCVLDVAETGAPEFAAATAATQRSMSVPKPTTATGALRDGATVSGEITEVNGSRRYPMDLGAARAFYVVDWDGPGACDQSLSVNVVGGSNGNFPCDDAVLRFEVPNGNPVLEIASAFGRTGAYSFRIVTEKVTSFALRPGQPVSGNLDTPGRVDVYTFDGVSSLHLTGPSACAHDVRFTIRRSDSNALVVGDRTLCGFDGFIPLPDTTVRYTLTVSSPDMVAQAYTIKIG